MSCIYCSPICSWPFVCHCYNASAVVFRCTFQIMFVSERGSPIRLATCASSCWVTSLDLRQVRTKRHIVTPTHHKSRDKAVKQAIIILASASQHKKIITCFGSLEHY